MDIYQIIAEEINYHLKGQSMTVEELSKKSGVGLSTLQRIIDGTSRRATLKTLVKIEIALGLPSPMFFTPASAKRVLATGSRNVPEGKTRQNWYPA